MSDVWKPVAGFEGLYEVAPCGAIRNAKTLRWLSPSEKDDGYMSVKLFRDGVGRNKTVHRIVAEAFLPNPESKPQVNHKDLNKRNNDVSNLEWVTQAENQSHAIRNGTNKTRISKLKMTEKYHDKFYQMTCLFPPSLFDELDALAIKTGVSKSEMIREATMEYVNRHTAEEGRVMAIPNSVCDNCVNTECLWRAPTGGIDPPVMVCPHKIEKPQTNYDRIISKTPEELAVWLAQQEYRRPRFDGWLPLCNHVMGTRTCHKDGCEKCWLDWLKQEVTNE